MPSISNVMTVDVEDWFHILEIEGGYSRSDWDSLESRVERNTDELLAVLDDGNAHATFFIVGWVAERHPMLVRKVAAAGHEVGSHSYWHEVVTGQDRASFAADLARSKAILEDVTGTSIQGFRAPGGSITSETAWAWEVIAEQGFRYDSSVWPPRTSSHGGVATPYRAPHRIQTACGVIDELPISTLGFGEWQVPYAGGGYLRLFPYGLIRLGVKLDNQADRPANVYVHPREIDPGQPRMELPLLRRFKYYTGLSSTSAKLRRLLRDFSFASAAKWLDENCEDVASRVHDVRPDPPVNEAAAAVARL